MNELLDALRDVVQEDAGGRGLAADPERNLLTECSRDFTASCWSVAGFSPGHVGIVTGFFIPTASPPAPETDGPPGAVFLARALTHVGIGVVLITDEEWMQPLQEGLDACSLGGRVEVLGLPREFPPGLPEACFRHGGRMTHLIAVERVGPSHTPASVQRHEPGARARADFEAAVPPGEWDRCHSMRGRDLTSYHAPAHLLFDAPGAPLTIGIGDGGNEIGMGKVPWGVVARNIPNGGLIACRVPTTYLIVAGVSNWGAYALAAGVGLVRGRSFPPGLFDPAREEVVLRRMVASGLVDGVAGRAQPTVDGLPFERHARVLRQLGEIVGA